MRTLSVILLSLGLLAAAPPQLTPYLVKDINSSPSTADSEPGPFVTLGDLALFQVETFGHGELWRTDGTAAGTYRLADDFFDSCGINLCGIGLVVAGGRSFFIRRPPAAGHQLWITDGTRAGTSFVGDTGDLDLQEAVWVARQGVLYFAAKDPAQEHGWELWRSDGTPAGTYEVLDLVPGPDSSYPIELTTLRGHLYFAAHSALWRSDGTAAGTVKLRDGRVESLHAMGSRVVFVGTDARGSELWASDGTAAGTRRISDLAPGAASPAFSGFRVVGKRLFFFAWTPAHGTQLYVTDGTRQGTQRPAHLSITDDLEYQFTATLGERLFFWTRDDLWTTDGTPQGTHRVPGACPGERSCLGGSPLLLHRGRLYYGIAGENEPELWSTDGTAQGSRKVKAIPDADWSWPAPLATAGGRLYFFIHSWDRSSTGIWATDGTTAGTLEVAQLAGYLDPQGGAAGGLLVFSGTDRAHGAEPWTSDGTPQGTRLLVDVAIEDIGGSHPRELMRLGDRALFFARNEEAVALWRSDGTESGTALVKRGLDGQTLWTASPTRVFFTTYQHGGVSELWASDGTAAGTVRLTPEGVSCRRELSAPVIKLGYRVFFSAHDWSHGTEPWVSDGTPAGTQRVADLNPGPDGSSPRGFMVFAGRAWFAAGLQLWKSDGTGAGTIALGPELQEIQPRLAFAGRLWFTGRNSLGRTELWSTDGVPGNTVRLAEMQAIESLTVHAGRLWFLSDGGELWSTGGTAADTRQLDLPVVPHQQFKGLLSDGVRLYLFGPGLWVSDGTAAGTRQISARGGYSLESGFWLPFGGRLFYDDADGSLCASDGTTAGTGPVRADGEPRYARLYRMGDRMVAVGDHGELWLSDGTAEGTKLLADLSPTTYPSQSLLKAGPRLFFSAWDAERGWELWAMRE